MQTHTPPRFGMIALTFLGKLSPFQEGSSDVARSYQESQRGWLLPRIYNGKSAPGCGMAVSLGLAPETEPRGHWVSDHLAGLCPGVQDMVIRYHQQRVVANLPVDDPLPPFLRGNKAAEALRPKLERLWRAASADFLDAQRRAAA